MSTPTLYATDYVLIKTDDGKMVCFGKSKEVIIYGDLDEAQGDANIMGNVQVVSCDKLSEADKAILLQQIIEVN